MVLNCIVCDSEFKRYGKQALTAKTCSYKCLGEFNKAEPNTKCSSCGKDFHMKESRKKRHKRTMGYFCSIECSADYRKTYFKGENNHQYGLKGNLNASFKGDIITKVNHNNLDLYKFVGYDYPNNNGGRVLFHRYVVQENYQLFDINFFELICDKYILKSNIDVHHKDNNHNNNDLENLELMTKSEHTSHHNKEKQIIRDSKGRIKRLQILKQ